MTRRHPLRRRIRLIAALVIATLMLVTGNVYAIHARAPIDAHAHTTLAASDSLTHTLFLPLTVTAPSPNLHPVTPASPSPADGALVPVTLAQLSWQGGDPDGDPVFYRVTLVTEAARQSEETTPDQQVYAGADTSCCPGALMPDTRYYWQVTAEDSHGATTVGPVWSFTTEATSPEPTFAEEVVALTNEERAKVGCPDLTVSPQLTQAAQEHSADMAVNDYFSHTSLDGRSPWDRIRATGYEYSRAAENIAAGYPTPQHVMDGWMASDGHRANILNCALLEIGVGYVNLSPDTGSVNYTHYWTQVFATPN
jgi:uncharacterized protein YkwD